MKPAEMKIFGQKLRKFPRVPRVYPRKWQHWVTTWEGWWHQCCIVSNKLQFHNSVILRHLDSLRHCCTAALVRNADYTRCRGRGHGPQQGQPQSAQSISMYNCTEAQSDSTSFGVFSSSNQDENRIYFEMKTCKNRNPISSDSNAFLHRTSKDITEARWDEICAAQRKFLGFIILQGKFFFANRSESDAVQWIFLEFHSLWTKIPVINRRIFGYKSFENHKKYKSKSQKFPLHGNETRRNET